MNAKEKTKKHFDDTAATYNDSENGKFVLPMYAALMKQRAGARGKLLDVGCGNGNLYGLLKGSTVEYYGADFSAGMIKAAKERYGERVEFVVADVETLPFENDTFDYLVCNASFHHYTKPDDALEEMARVLKSGGTMLLGDPYIFQPLRGVMNILTTFSPEGDFHFYGKHEMTKLLEKHNLTVEAKQKTGWFSVLYSIRKP